MLWRSREVDVGCNNEEGTLNSASGDSQVVPSSSWRALIKSISTFRGDLSSLTAPTFILAPTSLLEYCHFWYAGREEIRKPAQVPADQAEARFLEVTRMFVHLLKGQYSQRNTNGSFEKKPLNPFLGELFVARLDGDLLRAEQISHHPPGYAFNISAVGPKGIKIEQEGNVSIKARFSTTVVVEQIGLCTYRLGDGETYTATLPPLHLEGFIYGAPYIELDKTSQITSSDTGYKCQFSYSGAGWVSGKSHTLNAEITNKEGELLYTLQGQWNSLVTITNVKSGETTDFVRHGENSKAVEPEVVPISEQHELESQRAWQKVVDAIRANNGSDVKLHKTAIEDKQREMRRIEKAESRVWQSRWFKLVDGGDKEVDVYALDKEAYERDEFFKNR